MQTEERFTFYKVRIIDSQQQSRTFYSIERANELVSKLFQAGIGCELLTVGFVLPEDIVWTAGGEQNFVKLEMSNDYQRIEYKAGDFVGIKEKKINTSEDYKRILREALDSKLYFSVDICYSARPKLYRLILRDTNNASLGYKDFYPEFIEENFNKKKFLTCVTEWLESIDE